MGWKGFRNIQHGPGCWWGEAHPTTPRMNHPNRLRPPPRQLRVHRNATIIPFIPAAPAAAVLSTIKTTLSPSLKIQINRATGENPTQEKERERIHLGTDNRPLSARVSPRWVTTFGTGHAWRARGKVSPAQVRHGAAPRKEPCSSK